MLRPKRRIHHQYDVWAIAIDRPTLLCHVSKRKAREPRAKRVMSYIIDRLAVSPEKEGAACNAGGACMTRYVAKRLLSGLLTVFIAFGFNFVLIHIAPGDSVSVMMGKDNNDPVLRQALMEKYGLDQPLYVQFYKQLTMTLRGDLGTSYIYKRPVVDMITEKLWPTLLLVLSAAVLALFLGTSMGILSARHEGSIVDGVFSGMSYVLNAMPSFWLGLMLIIVFATNLNLLPSSGMIDPRADYTGLAYALDVLTHMVLPLSTLVLVQIPAYFRISKSSVLQVKNEEFITTFRATGMSERRIFNKYVLKNAILPVVTLFGINMAFLISGVSLIEIVFAWPGTGRLTLTAINQRDYTVLMGMYLIVSVMVAVTMIIVDIVYALLDPRIRY